MTKEEFENLKPGDEIWTHTLIEEQVSRWFFIDKHKREELIVNRRKGATLGSIVHYQDAFLNEEQATNALIDWVKSVIKGNKTSAATISEEIKRFEEILEKLESSNGVKKMKIDLVYLGVKGGYVKPVADYVQRSLDASNPEAGLFESLETVSQRVSHSYSRLIEALARKGVLTAQDVVRIAEDRRNDDAYFVLEKNKKENI